MPATDISARIRATALAVIEKQCLGDEFGFDTAPSVVQGPQGVMVVYTLLTTMRSPLLGQSPMANIAQIPSPSPTGEQVEQVVSNAIRELRNLSQQVLADGNGHAKTLSG